MDPKVIRMDHIGKELGRVVDAAIVESGLSVRHVSKESGIPFTTLNRKLRGQGKTPLNVVELYHISRVLDRSLKSLLPEEVLS
jgi:transcriptional regulator with XRE-family HTH domain